MSKNIVTHQYLWKNCSWLYGKRNTIYKLFREKDCPSFKVNGKWYVDINKFHKWYANKIEKERIEKEKQKNAKNIQH